MLTDIKGVDWRKLGRADLNQYRTCMAAWFCYYHRDEMEYTLGPPESEYQYACKHPPPYVPPQLDCSTFATYCYAVGGAPNPNNGTRDFTYAYHNTGSLWKRGTLVGGASTRESRLMPGDLLFWGYGSQSSYGVGGTGEHVSVYVGRGIQISHGQDAGPLKYGWKSGSSKSLIGIRRYPWL